MLSEGSSRFHPALTALVDGEQNLGPLPGLWRCIHDFRYRKPRTAENMMSGEAVWETRKSEFSSVVIFMTQQGLYSNSRAHCQGKIGLFPWKMSPAVASRRQAGSPAIRDSQPFVPISI
jgi:hypothetical protein